MGDGLGLTKDRPYLCQQSEEFDEVTLVFMLLRGGGGLIFNHEPVAKPSLSHLYDLSADSYQVDLKTVMTILECKIIQFPRSAR